MLLSPSGCLGSNVAINREVQSQLVFGNAS